MPDKKRRAANSIHQSKSLSTRINRIVLVILFMIFASFLFSVYLITEGESKQYEIRESENTIRTLSNNIYSKLEGYMELSYHDG